MRYFQFQRFAVLALALLFPTSCMSAPLDGRVPVIVQLQHASYAQLAAYPFSVAVVDPDYSGLTAEHIRALHEEAKLLIGYLSVGEAEDYRTYWQPDWKVGNPAWILAANPDWEGNFRVDYRNRQWQELTFARAEQFARLGYDGLFLDVVEAFETLAETQGHANNTDEQLAMVNFMRELGRRTRAINPNFQLIPNGGVELLQHASFLSAINGVFKEDTFYNEDGKINEPWVEADLRYLAQAREAGKYVIAIEYPVTLANQQAAINASLAKDFVPFIGSRKLDSIPTINREFYRNYRLNASATDFNTLLNLTGGIAVASSEAPADAPEPILAETEEAPPQATLPEAVSETRASPYRQRLRERLNRARHRARARHEAFRERISERYAQQESERPEWMQYAPSRPNRPAERPMQ